MTSQKRSVSATAGVRHMIRSTEMTPATGQILWLARQFIAARLDYAKITKLSARISPNLSRAVPILLCHLLLEIAAHSRKRLLIGPPCYAQVMSDEVSILAAIDLAQQHDISRLPHLLQEICGTSEVYTVLEAALKLGETLMQSGLRVEAALHLQAGLLPTIH